MFLPLANPPPACNLLRPLLAAPARAPVLPSIALLLDPLPQETTKERSMLLILGTTVNIKMRRITLPATSKPRKSSDPVSELSAKTNNLNSSTKTKTKTTCLKIHSNHIDQNFFIAPSSPPRLYITIIGEAMYITCIIKLLMIKFAKTPKAVIKKVANKKIWAKLSKSV